MRLRRVVRHYKRTEASIIIHVASALTLTLVVTPNTSTLIPGSGTSPVYWSGGTTNVARAMKLSSVVTMITAPLIARAEPLHLDWREGIINVASVQLVNSIQ
mmetsp:Transcript_58288/g.69585  ORF Transcript_58288/g.69585 Transcript_58288/m.69585 type:complete len:102 (-) Transcript_58288:35-340(-)